MLGFENYIYVFQTDKNNQNIESVTLYKPGLDINFFTHLSIWTSDYDIYLSKNKFCLSKKFQ